jgi:cold shock protein
MSRRWKGVRRDPALSVLVAAAEESMAEARQDGFVVKLMTDKGFGFIADTAGTEYFFHRSALKPQEWAILSVNTPVTFVVRSNPKGPRAEDVTVSDQHLSS